jgi:hypothetical protein
VIEQVRDALTRQPNDEVLAYFYFNRNDRSRCTL